MRYVLLLFLISKLTFASAQVCEGSLGANIFESGDFGTGPQTVLLADPGFAPGYNYTTVVPADGEYTITKMTSALAGLYPSWLAVRDNSLNRDEYFMVVNASFEPGLFYQEDITDLCENTLYEFSADVINLIESSVTDHLRPNVDFLINGQSVFSTGDIPQTEAWITYGFTFVTAADQTSLSLSLRNNAPGGRGNDLGLDNIAFRPCGPSTFVGIDSDETTFLCFDDEPQVLIADVADPTRAVQWQISNDSITWLDITGATSATYLHDNFDPGSYYYRYVSAGTSANIGNVKCRVISDVLLIEVLPEVFEFRDTICEGLSYSFGDQSLTETGMYSSDAISSKGCDSMTTLDLVVLPYRASVPTVVIDDPSCPEGSDGMINISSVDGGYGGYVWQLDSANQEDIYSDLTAGTYVLSIIDTYGCETEIPFTLENPPAIDVMITGADTYSFGSEVLLGADISAVVDQQVWSDGSGLTIDTSSMLSIVATRDQLIILTAVQGEGCTYADTLAITVTPPVLPTLPNILSANGDNLNDELLLNFAGQTVAQVASFVLYDRWGNLVTTQQAVTPTPPHALWDGNFGASPATPGTYTYFLDLVLADGISYQLAGAITVIR
jgi:hypothetical protein